MVGPNFEYFNWPLLHFVTECLNQSCTLVAESRESLWCAGDSNSLAPFHHSFFCTERSLALQPKIDSKAFCGDWHLILHVFWHKKNEQDHLGTNIIQDSYTFYIHVALNLPTFGLQVINKNSCCFLKIEWLQVILNLMFFLIIFWLNWNKPRPYHFWTNSSTAQHPQAVNGDPTRQETTALRRGGGPPACQGWFFFQSWIL